MSRARLYCDGSNSWWALAECDACKSFHRYPLRDAVRWPVACLTCHRKLDARQAIREGVKHFADISPEIRNTFAADDHKRTAQRGQSR